MTSARAFTSLALVLLAFVAPLGCGGVTIVEPPGSGAGGAGGASATGNTSTGAQGGTTTTAANSGTTSTASGSNALCVELGEAYMSALDEASRCNACIDADGCIQGMIFTDICGCPVGTDGFKPGEVQKARETQFVFINAGCTLLDCGKTCPVGNEWHCGAAPGGGCDGRCVSP